MLVFQEHVFKQVWLYGQHPCLAPDNLYKDMFLKLVTYDVCSDKFVMGPI